MKLEKYMKDQNKHIILVFNMGHSGGRWFQDVCNIHPDVQLWQEANHYLKVTHLDTKVQLDKVYEFFMEQYKKSSMGTIGLIKAFDYRLIRFCEEKEGSIIQMYRNPIGVVNAKIGKKMDECRSRNIIKDLESERGIFEAHVEFYAYNYSEYLKNSDKWPIIKLEDLNIDISEDGSYFKKTTEKYLKIKWEKDHIDKIGDLSKIKGDLSRAYSKHISDQDIFESWPDWKKEIFIRYFKNLITECGYVCQYI